MSQNCLGLLVSVQSIEIPASLQRKICAGRICVSRLRGRTLNFLSLIFRDVPTMIPSAQPPPGGTHLPISGEPDPFPTRWLLLDFRTDCRQQLQTSASEMSLTHSLACATISLNSLLGPVLQVCLGPHMQRWATPALTGTMGLALQDRQWARHWAHHFQTLPLLFREVGNLSNTGPSRHSTAPGS